MSIDFKKVSSGWIISDEATAELTRDKELDSDDWCCSLFNDNGSLAEKTTISADGSADAARKCMDNARAGGYSRGSVRRGSCDNQLQDIKARVDALESKQSRGKRCCAQQDSQPVAVKKGTEQLIAPEGNEFFAASKSAHWNRGDAGDCESTFVTLDIYEDGRYVIYHRTHDNGSFFGDTITIYLELYKNDGTRIAKLFVCNNQSFESGGTDENPRRGDSRAIREEFNDIDMSRSKRTILCN